MNQHENSEEALFKEALLKASDAERAAYLEGACRNDPALRGRLELLLEGHFKAKGFLDTIQERDGPRTPSSAAAPNSPNASESPNAATAVPAAATDEGVRDPLKEGPGAIIDRYKLLQKLGEGGFGAVYVAEQKEPVKRRVALKIIKLGMDTRQVVARFEAERQALALMDHPNIAKVLDAGATQSGRPYFVMELVRGIPITQYCDENNLPPIERLQLFMQVCRAIQHAHQKGVIHRDIKPSNILVTLHDGVPVPKVIDFGIAKATQQELTDKTIFTQFQQFIGTPAYMSPEQAEMSGLDIDTRSDIYSLGVLLYELLTGKTPFDGRELLASGLDEMRRTIREREPMRPSTRLSQTLVAADVRRLEAKSEVSSQKSGIEGASSSASAKAAVDGRRLLRIRETVTLLRGDLDWVVMKCLEKDRARRYETANALASDIHRHLNQEPVAARPPSTVYRFQKLVRRNKLAFSAAATVLAALVAGLGISTWQFVQKSRAYQRMAAAELKERSAREAAQKAEARETQLRSKAEADELAARQRAYASDMNLAQQALAANNLGRAWELLNRHRPAKAVVSNQSSVISNQVVEPLNTGHRSLITDFRGWEWRYLWQQCHGDALYTLCQGSNPILSLSVAPDGKWLAVGETGRGRLAVWDLTTRREIERLLPTGHIHVRVAFSPREPLLAFSGVTDASPHVVRLWNGALRQIVGELPIAGSCCGLAFSEDGQSLVISTRPARESERAEITLWSVSDRAKLKTFPSRQKPVVGTPFAATRNLSLAAEGFDGRLRVVDLGTGEERWQVRASDDPIRSLAFSPDGTVLASGAGYVDSVIRLWDVATGSELARLQGHARGAVFGLVFWPDGKTLASAGGDQTIRLWDLTDRTFERRPRRTLRGHIREVTRLLLLPDNKTLVSGSKDGALFVWDTTAPAPESGFSVLATAILPTYRSYYPVAAPWAIAPDGKSVITVDQQGTVAEWSGAGFQERQTLLELGQSIRGPLISDDGQFVAATSTDGLIQLWDLRRRTQILRDPIRTVAPVAFLENARKLVTFDADGSFHEWDLRNWEKTRSWKVPEKMFVYGFKAAFSANEQSIVHLNWRGISLLRNLATGQESDLNLNMIEVTGAAYSPDGRFFTAVSATGHIKLWDAGTWQEVDTLRSSLQGVHSVAFSPNGRRLATGSDAGEAVKLWDVESRQELLTLNGQGSEFLRTAFSAEGNVLGSMNRAGLLHLWRAPSLEEIAAAEKGK